MEILTHEEDSSDPDKIRRSLGEIVSKLEPTAESSSSWGSVMAEHREEWERLKAEIHERQRALKALVKKKKAGDISPDEFERKYREIQDELTTLEFKVYNLRLGTDVKV